MATCSTASIDWPDDHPAADEPVTSIERERLKRQVSSAPGTEGSMRSTVDSGTISFVVELRTLTFPMSSAVVRNRPSACT